MLKRITITNHLGESVDYVIEGAQADNPSGLFITSIDGLGPVKASMNMSENQTYNGSRFISSRVPGRDLTIQAVYSYEGSIEDARLLTYKYFPINSKINIEIETDNRTVHIDGYVESNEPNIFSNQSGCTITIRCESPYFYGEDLQATFTNENTTGSAYIDANEIEQNDGLTMYFRPRDKISTLNVYETNSSQGILYGQMNFDFTKLPSTLPNTAPTNLNQQYCMFEVSEDPDEPYRFYRRLPDIVSNSDLKYTMWGNYLYTAEVNFVNHAWVLTTNEYDYDTWSNNWELQYSSELVFYDAWPDTYQILWVGTLATHPYVLVRHFSSSYDCFGLYRIDESYSEYQTPIGGWYYKQQVSSYDPQSHYITVVEASSGSVGDCWVFIKNGTYIYFIEGAKDTSSNTFRWSNTSAIYDTDTTRIIDFAGSQYRAVSLDGMLYLLAYDQYGHYILLAHNEAFSDSFWVDYTSEHDLSVLSGVDLEETLVLSSSTTNTIEIPGIGPAVETVEKLVILTTTDIYRIMLSGFDNRDCEKVKENILDNARTDFYMAKTNGNDKYLLIGATENGYPYTESPNNKYLIDDDILTVKTRNGSKSVTLQRNGITYNVLNTLLASPTWFKIHRGDNYYMYSCTPTEGAPTHNYISTATIEYSRLYEGV